MRTNAVYVASIQLWNWCLHANRVSGPTAIFNTKPRGIDHPASAGRRRFTQTAVLIAVDHAEPMPWYQLCNSSFPVSMICSPMTIIYHLDEILCSVCAT